MKHYLALFITLLTVTAGSTSLRAAGTDFDDSYRFIFYAVLEGCYQDGLSNDDVAQILLRGTNNYYSQFIYACPICTPTIHALEAYQSRPRHFYGLKTDKTTFGEGLSPEVKKQLYSEKAEDRLTAINTLMKGWVSRRIALLRLTDSERKELEKKLGEMREKGNSYLKGFAKDDPEKFKMSPFGKVQQCAACNGACLMKLESEKK
jgi:hypothetical protein